jgi:hypothetical protein
MAVPGESGPESSVKLKSRAPPDFEEMAEPRGVDLISDALRFGSLWYAGPNAVANVIGYATRDPASSLSQSVLSRTNPASYRAQSAL